MLAERRCGELLRDMDKHPPGPDRSHRVTDLPPTLEELVVKYVSRGRLHSYALQPLDTALRRAYRPAWIGISGAFWPSASQCAPLRLPIQAGNVRGPSSSATRMSQQAAPGPPALSWRRGAVGTSGLRYPVDHRCLMGKGEGSLDTLPDA